MYVLEGNTISNVAYGTLVQSSVTDICYHMFTNYREAQNSPFLYNIVYSSLITLSQLQNNFREVGIDGKISKSFLNDTMVFDSCGSRWGAVPARCKHGN
jgi:hypothetical protein